MSAGLATAPAWWETFRPFGAAHALVAGACVAVMLGLLFAGRRLRGGAGEARLRRGWAVSIYVWQAWALGWYFLPANFRWDFSLPLQVCDLAVLVSGAALLSEARWLRGLLYFWGLGLSTQAFVTPILVEGPADWHFWFFWVGHTQIVGSSLYDIGVRGYRPTPGDLRRTIAITTVYAAGMIALNAALGSEYGYLAPTRTPNPTLLDVLGPWPWRFGPMAAMTIAVFVVLWAIWPMADRAGRWWRRGAGPSGPAVD